MRSSVRCGSGRRKKWKKARVKPWRRLQIVERVAVCGRGLASPTAAGEAGRTLLVDCSPATADEARGMWVERHIPGPRLMKPSRGHMTESPPGPHQLRSGMRNEFTAVIERDGDWFVGYCPEIPGANGQGKTAEECRANLAAAIALILEDRREDGLRGVPTTAEKSTVVIS